MHKVVSFAQNQDLEFKKALHLLVSAYFSENGLSKAHTPGMLIKSIFLLSIYILPFVAILTLGLPAWIVMLLYFIMGVGKAGVGMSIMHDGNHASYSENQKVNTMMGYTMYLLGADSYNWKIKHNKLHHVFTNVYGKDEDIDSRAILRFAYASPLKKYHRFQQYYAWFLYLLMSLSMVFFDIPKRFIYRKKGITNISRSAFQSSLIKLVVAKIIYFGVVFALPMLVTSLLWWQVVAGFFIMHFTAGFILSVVFQMAHVVAGPLQTLPDENGKINDTLLLHQLKTTSDFSKGNKILSWYVGGLNYQVEHHLFPRICHMHYPALAKIVEATTKEYNMPYYVYNSFGSAIRSHYNTLKELGRTKVNYVNV